MVRSGSFTEYVPKYVIVPWAVALFSSSCGLRDLPEVINCILGTVCPHHRNDVVAGHIKEGNPLCICAEVLDRGAIRIRLVPGDKNPRSNELVFDWIKGWSKRHREMKTDTTHSGVTLSKAHAFVR